MKKIDRNLEDPGSDSVFDNMTETETKPANGNGASNGDASADILWQMEYYFGDFNLPKDKFLKAQIDEAKDGWISLDIMLKFQRLANLTKDKDLIIKALKTSDILETNQEKLEVRRKPSLPVPVSAHSSPQWIYHNSMLIHVHVITENKTTLKKAKLRKGGGMFEFHRNEPPSRLNAEHL